MKLPKPTTIIQCPKCKGVAPYTTDQHGPYCALCFHVIVVA